MSGVLHLMAMAALHAQDGTLGRAAQLARRAADELDRMASARKRDAQGAAR